MNKKNLLLFLSIITVNYVLSQNLEGYINPSLVSKPRMHYLEEYTFDEPSNSSTWGFVNIGLHVAFTTTDELYLRREVPKQVDEKEKWIAHGWKGERLNAQMLIWSMDSIEQIRIKASNLHDSKGNIISSDHISINMIRYVLSNFPYNGYPENCEGPLDSVWLMPDRFESFDRFDLPSKTVRPIWISLNIPDNATSGKYNGYIEIVSEKENKILEIEINVQNQVLPKPSDWKFRLDLWQNPWAVAWYYNVEPWKEEHKLLLRKHLKLYADAGGTFITTYAIHSPWSDNSYMIEGGMIEWIRKVDGSWKFDYKIFDEYVNLCMELGINEAITVYTPVPWGNRFRYLDEKTGNYIYEEWPVESENFKANWTAFMNDLMIHLNQKQWFDITYLGINENPLEVTLGAIKTIKNHSEKWKITYAGNWHPELSDLIDDYCAIISSEPDSVDIALRRIKGFTTTFYECCTPAKPNNFVFSPPVEGRYLGWHTFANGYDGFLRWAYDAWPADPMRDARHALWPAGDCYLVYPGGNSCIRYEKLREGISDFEKINILIESAKKSNDKEVISLLNELNDFLNNFRLDTNYHNRNYSKELMKKNIEDGILLINKLSEKLPNK